MKAIILIKITLLFCLSLGLISCSNQEPNSPETVTSRVECTSPRTQMCSKEFRPVCALKDNGVRCITTPCDSTDEVTFSNACMACADNDVYSYTQGKCLGVE